jgi:hypothetical protein
MTAYEIWLGKYSVEGESKKEPELIGRIIASSFKVACWLYELQSTIESIQNREESGKRVEDIHFGQWYYNPTTNSNSWTGKYYQTKEEAQKSFT